METNETTNVLSESEKLAGEWFNNSSAAMMDIYKKQFDLLGSFYSNFLRSFLGGNKKEWNPVKEYSDLFRNTSSVKPLFMPFGFGTDHSLTGAFEPMLKQMADYDKYLFGALSRYWGIGNSNWENLSEKYLKMVEKRNESFKELTDKALETYSRQAELAMDSGKHFLQDMNRHLSTIAKLSREFWTEAFGVLSQQPEPGKIPQNGAAAENKKQAKANVNL